MSTNETGTFSSDQILLYAPKTVLWRLAGLNRNLNQLLINEHFWRQKCERLWRVLYTGITNYRMYYLLRNKDGRGKLYRLNTELIREGVSMVFRCLNTVHMVLSNKNLYLLIAGTEQTRPVQEISITTGVNSAVGISYHKPSDLPADIILICYLIMTDTGIWILKLYLYTSGRFDRYELIRPSPPFDGYTNLIRNYVLRGRRIIYQLLLFDDGSLRIHNDHTKESTTLTTGVIMIRIFRDSLIAVLSDGSLHRWYLDSMIKTQTITVPEGHHYINIYVCHDTLAAITDLGTIDLYQYHQGLEYTTTIHHPHLLNTMTMFGEATVMVGIDGSGYLHLPHNHLLIEPPRLKWSGIIGILDSYIIATDC